MFCKKHIGAVSEGMAVTIGIVYGYILCINYIDFIFDTSLVKFSHIKLYIKYTSAYTIYYAIFLDKSQIFTLIFSYILKFSRKFLKFFNFLPLKKLKNSEIFVILYM